MPYLKSVVNIKSGLAKTPENIIGSSKLNFYRTIIRGKKNRTNSLSQGWISCQDHKLKCTRSHHTRQKTIPIIAVIAPTKPIATIKPIFSIE